MGCSSHKCVLHLFFQRPVPCRTQGCLWGPFGFVGCCEPARGSKGPRDERGRAGLEWRAPTGNKASPDWLLPLHLQVLPAQVLLRCVPAGVASTNVPTSVPGELEECRAPSSLPLRPPRQAPPNPWLATSSWPQRNQAFQDPGRSRGLFASLGKSGTRACHTSKAEGAARALQQRLSARGLGSLRREGVHATAGGHLRAGLSSHHQGAELRQAGLVSDSPCMAPWRQW